MMKDSIRNLSPQLMFQHLAATRRPGFQFKDHQGDFASWKSALKPKILDCLGTWPDLVDPNPELMAEWTDRGILKRRYLIDVGPGISAALVVAFPEKRKGRLPAILCWHGHGQFGKDSVMGNSGDKEIATEISNHNYDYGFQMARAGFITFALDWMGFGERRDTDRLTIARGRDWCNLYYLHATLLGMTPLSINLRQAQIATSFVCTLPEVDADRLGVMGISGGGTATLWTALTDDRFKAAEIICYSDLWEIFGFTNINYCGMQVAPGLYRYADVPDLQGLLAPLPLLVDIGAYDRCFLVDGAMKCFHQVSAIYKAANAQDRLRLNLYADGHVWESSQSAAFFGAFLQRPSLQAT